MLFALTKRGRANDGLPDQLQYGFNTGFANGLFLHSAKIGGLPMTAGQASLRTTRMRP